ncbi:MAG: type I restriction enzyme HsdR N-terminal domain-containing protein [Anaerolineae bacterium]|nr:type I restriction enzyme HsdR N-terminal domain-containing protein [Anaerolineae bacterium]
MDFSDLVRELASRIPTLKQQKLIKTEEATKNALVMPFIKALGYDPFNPLEVTPELIADVGIKKGEKVDYAILKDGKPIMLFECKSYGTDLSKVQASQLYRYFSVTEARFGILTDGAVYQFYTDLEQPNRMDPKPFFVVDISEAKDRDIDELKRFTKSAFDVERILSSAAELKYKGAIKQILAAELADPSEEFVRLFASRVYSGRLKQAVVSEFTDITKQAFKQFISEQVENRLKNALQQETETSIAEQKELSKAEPELTPQNGKQVETTEDEMEAHRIVRAILREVVDAKRIVMRDAQSYCAILLDDNNRKSICRLRFSKSRMQIGIINGDKQEEILPLESLDDIYHYTDQLKAAVQHYEDAGETANGA